jgi:endonuclease/exonuclease/phosphatase family metal-dependent hydrolase
MKYIFTILLLLYTPYLLPQEYPVLKVISLNMWSGLDYEGSFKMGEYEPAGIKEKRLNLLIKQLREHKPDIILLQEVNPVSSYSSRLADSLGYDEIHQVTNAGFKVGPFGIPSNLKEGNVILARKELELKESAAVKLSGGFGLHGDAFSLHFNEAIFLISGVIKVNGRDIVVVNTHLYAPHYKDGKGRRLKEIKGLIDFLENYKGLPVILGGDFNTVFDSEEIQMLIKEGAMNECFFSSETDVYTWDPLVNTNIKYSLEYKGEDSAALREAEWDRTPRKIDYIFVNDLLGCSAVINTGIIFTEPEEDLFISDHFGIMSEIDISGLGRVPQVSRLTEWEILPILSYDTDFGLGYGLKAFVLNTFKGKESFDVVAYSASKGLKWYRFVFSIPDFELRQGTEYPLAFDLIADYSPSNSNYFGIGNNASYENLETYMFEPVDIRLQLNRGFSSTLVLQGGIRYSYIKNYDIEESGALASLGGLNTSISRYFGLYTSLRYDTRNSFINPSGGVVLQGEVEYVPDLEFNKADFQTLSLSAQYYYKLFYPKTIFAVRFLISGKLGDVIPLQNLLSAGGGNNLRGFQVNRIIDKYLSVLNAEIRFPVYWRFGAIAGVDAANVWNNISSFGVSSWKVSPAAGLRFYFDNFIVRLDAGFSKETTGFYMNFGHMF